MTKITRDIE